MGLLGAKRRKELKIKGLLFCHSGLMPTGHTVTISGKICKTFMVYGLRGLDSQTNHSGNRGGREACGGSGAVLASRIAFNEPISPRRGGERARNPLSHRQK